MSNFLSILFFIFISINTFAQRGGLLIQQYNKGPSLGQTYSKWNLHAGPEISLINAELRTSSPLFSVGATINIEYLFSKTVGLLTGLNYTPISYKYSVSDSLVNDRIKYISIPLFLRVHPTDRVSLNFGVQYNHFQKGEKIISFNNTLINKRYKKGIFENSFGYVLQVGYHFWEQFYSYLNYRWVKKTSPITQPETNNSKGLQLGMTYTFWNSAKRQ